MNTIEIWNALASNKYTKNYFKGVYALDCIPKIIKNKPALLIVNLDKSNSPGSHWVAIYLPVKGSPEYFDSFGIEPLYSEFLEFFKKNKYTMVLYNKTQLQDFLSTVCGQYCCVYLLNKAKHISLKNFIEKNFKSDHRYLQQNDKKVESLFKRNFKNNSAQSSSSSTKRFNKTNDSLLMKNLRLIGKRELLGGGGGGRNVKLSNITKSNNSYHVQSCRPYSSRCYK